MQAYETLQRFKHLLKDKKAVIFDMDGILFDTTSVHEQAFKQSLRELSEKFKYSLYTGKSTEQTFQDFLTDDSLHAFLKEKKQAYVSQNLEDIQPFKYAEKILYLLKRHGYILALATSSSKKRVENLIRMHDFNRIFNVIITNDDVVSAKPHPEIYKKTISLLRLAPEQALVIEDSPNGILAAKNAGIKVLALLHTHEAKELVNADLILKDIYTFYVFTSFYFYNKEVSFNSVIKPYKTISVIPAAGKGSRLGFDKPKILYPILNSTPLKVIYEKIRPLSSKIFIIANPQGSPHIIKYISEQNLDAQIIIIENSLGTADSILAAEESCQKSNEESILIIWGDQIGILQSSLQNSLASHQQNNSDLSIPVVLKYDPYIHLQRNEEGIIIDVLRKRFTDYMPEYGENDSGIFIVKKQILFDALKIMKERYLAVASRNKDYRIEFDFLDIIPFISMQNKRILTLPYIHEYEAIGMNTLDEVRFHEGRIDRNS
jgi:HAD superfamily hydrolase (TIGR01509 family)